MSNNWNKTHLDDFVESMNNTIGGQDVGFNNFSNSSGLIGEGHSTCPNVNSHSWSADSLNNQAITEVTRQNLMK